MDLGVILSDVTTAATTTLTAFGTIIAFVLGIKLAISVAKRFLPK